MLLQQRKRVRRIGGIYKRLAYRLLQGLKRRVRLLFQRRKLYIHGLRRDFKCLHFVRTDGYLPQYYDKRLHGNKRDTI